MTNVKLDKVNMIIEDHFEGVKYHFFRGRHFNKGHLCFDIAFLNQYNGRILKLHYNSKTVQGSDDAAKTERDYKWQQIRKDFDEMVKRRSKLEEEEDKLAIVQDKKENIQ